MSYTALYRKWRPKDFTEVRGQDAIVTTLKNQIISNRIGHAYLFCGTRGTGKTSIAKIFAKAVNCEHPVDGNPCGECASCKAIAAGNSMSVIEMDAASNNGVNDVREIRDSVAYSPTDGKYIVYIIDEVHMLSTEAFNALLKTLEEPPAYVIFILATTEAHKLPVTILSRCQRYDFKRIGVDTLVGRLNEIIEAEGIRAQEQAVRYIARTADGAFRDALSLLDQCSAFFFGEEITYERALEVLGAVDTGVFSTFLRDIVAGSITEAIKLLDKISIQGRDLSQFVVDFIWYLRNILLVKAAKDASEVVDISSEDLSALKAEAQAIEESQILRYITVFSELSNDLKFSSTKRILIEIAVIKLCKPAMQTDYESILDRLRVIENQLEAGIPSAPGEFVRSKASSADSAGDSYEPSSEEKEALKSLPAATIEDIKQVAQTWGSITRDIPDPCRAILRESVPSVRTTDGKLMVQVTNKTMLMLLNASGGSESLGESIAKNIGRTVEFEIVAKDEVKSSGEHYPDAQMFGFDIEVNDDEF